MTDPSCIFCKIIAGAIPALRVYEDDQAFAFLDIGPLAEGHLLVIPKRHYHRLEDMDPDAVAAVARLLPRLSRAVIQVTGCPAYNVLQNNGKEAGQEVGHVHFHIIPRTAADGLGYRWNAGKYAPGRAEELHQQMITAVQG